MRTLHSNLARPVATAATLSVAPAAFYAAKVSPRIRTWGTTDMERDRAWPGDDLLPNPAFVWTNAMTIDRPATEAWPWITQLGQGRAGLYSYDWLENALLADVHSAAQVRPELQGPLEVGDRVIRMTRYAPYNPVALYEPGRALVLGGVNDTDEQLHAGRPTSTWAFIVEPVDDQQCRLVIRSRASALDARLQGPFQFVMQHKLMLGIKQRTEGSWSPSTADVVVPLSWFAAATVAALHANRALRSTPAHPQDLALASLAAVAAEWLMFWDMPARRRGAVMAALVGSALLPSGGGR